MLEEAFAASITEMYDDLCEDGECTEDATGMTVDEWQESADIENLWDETMKGDTEESYE